MLIKKKSKKVLKNNTKNVKESKKLIKNSKNEFNDDLVNENSNIKENKPKKLLKIGNLMDLLNIFSSNSNSNNQNQPNYEFDFKTQSENEHKSNYIDYNKKFNLIEKAKRFIFKKKYKDNEIVENKNKNFEKNKNIDSIEILKEESIEHEEIKQKNIEVDAPIKLIKIDMDGFKPNIDEVVQVNEVGEDIHLRSDIIKKLTDSGIDKNLVNNFVSKSEYESSGSIDLKKGFYNSSQENSFMYSANKLKNIYDNAEGDSPSFGIPKIKEMYTANQDNKFPGWGVMKNTNDGENIIERFQFNEKKPKTKKFDRPDI
jgi:hypothetical protein